MTKMFDRLDVIVVTTENGERHEFAVDDFDMELETDYEEYGPGPVHTVVGSKTLEFSGEIRCVKHP